MNEIYDFIQLLDMSSKAKARLWRAYMDTPLDLEAFKHDVLTEGAFRFRRGIGPVTADEIERAYRVYCQHKEQVFDGR